MDAASFQLIGRAATDEEVAKFLTHLNEQENLHPDVATSSTDAAGNPVNEVKTGISMEGRLDLAKDAVKTDSQDSGELQGEQMGANFSQWLWNAVASSSRGAGVL